MYCLYTFMWPQTFAHTGNITMLSQMCGCLHVRLWLKKLKPNCFTGTVWDKNSAIWWWKLTLNAPSSNVNELFGHTEQSPSPPTDMAVSEGRMCWQKMVTYLSVPATPFSVKIYAHGEIYSPCCPTMLLSTNSLYFCFTRAVSRYGEWANRPCL